MDILNRTDVQELIEVTGEWCISLYMHTHSIGWEQQQNTIRLKNLLTRVRRDLSEYGLRRPDIEGLLHPEELPGNGDLARSVLAKAGRSSNACGCGTHNHL